MDLTSSSPPSIEDAEPEIKKKIKSPELDRKITSWEVYNILLRKLVDRLIDLGASRDIKIVAFQVWALYLRASRVAFVSKDEVKLPALSLGFQNKDVRALYGIKNLRRRLFTQKRKRDESHSSNENSEDNECDEQEGSKLNDSSNVSGSRQTEEQFNSQFKRKRRVVFKSSACEVLKDISGQKPESNAHSARPNMSRKTRSRIKRVVNDRRFCNKREKHSLSQVTIVTLITIVRIALLVVGDEIYLADIIRWICEGRITFNHQHKKISSYGLNVYHHLANMKWQSFMMDMRNVTRALNLNDIPTPNLFNIAERYCDELNLPNQFRQTVLKLMAVSKVTMDYSKYDFDSFPDYECRVMAFILFTFKLTCSLDDVTEHHLSEFAELVDDLRSIDDDDAPAADIPKLFSWRKWVRFVECRKAVLARHHVPTNNMTYNNGVASPNVFLDYWEKVNLYCQPNRTINPQIVSRLKKERNALSQKYAECENDSIHYPVSLTPFKTYTEHLIANHRKLLQRESRDILSADFSADVVNMTGNIQWYSDIAEQVGLKVKVVDPDDHFDQERCLFENSSLLARTSLSRADFCVDVEFEDDQPPEMISNRIENGPRPAVCQPEFCVKGGRRSKSIKVFRSQRYWCLHECRKKMTVEEFEELAINNFPSSFLWLLCECAAMLRATPKDLYFQLIFVETKLSQLDASKLVVKSAMKINENEW